MRIRVAFATLSSGHKSFLRQLWSYLSEGRSVYRLTFLIPAWRRQFSMGKVCFHMLMHDIRLVIRRSFTQEATTTLSIHKATLIENY